MIMEQSLNQSLEKALCWLSESGVRVSDPNIPAYGGLLNGYDWKNKNYPYVYNEITGYGISAYVQFYRWFREEAFLNYAVQAADYLLKFQVKNESVFQFGAFPHSLSLKDNAVKNLYYAFDAGICIQGLMDLYLALGDRKYLRSAVDASRWLIRMQRSDGSFFAYFDETDGSLSHEGITFVGDGGCLHAKLAVALLKFRDNYCSEAPEFRDCARRVLNRTLELQHEDGSFWANDREAYVFTHAHCYALEGFLHGQMKTQDESYYETFKRGVDWLMDVQTADGALLRDYKADPRYSRYLKADRIFSLCTSDATAQAVRLWTIMYVKSHEEKYRESAQRGIGFLKRMQCLEERDPNMLGAFFYQVRRSRLFRSRTPVMYTWCTLFASAAMSMYREAEGKSADDLLDMIF